MHMWKQKGATFFIKNAKKYVFIEVFTWKLIWKVVGVIAIVVVKFNLNKWKTNNNKNKKCNQKFTFYFEFQNKKEKLKHLLKSEQTSIIHKSQMKRKYFQHTSADMSSDIKFNLTPIPYSRTTKQKMIRQIFNFFISFLFFLLFSVYVFLSRFYFINFIICSYCYCWCCCNLGSFLCQSSVIILIDWMHTITSHWNHQCLLFFFCLLSSLPLS